MSFVTGYKVYHSTSLDETYKRMATVLSSGNHYIDRSITNGKNYYYVKVYRIINGKKIYSYSSEIRRITLSR